MPKRPNLGIQIRGKSEEKVARVRLGSYEFRKKGISRFDLSDPYHLVVALTWPQFLAALLVLYLSVNVVIAALFWLVPGSVANARPGSLSDAFFLRCIRRRFMAMLSRQPRSYAGSRSSPSWPGLPLSALAAAGEAGLRRQSGGGDAQRQSDLDGADRQRARLCSPMRRQS
jgi:hypothetical protein